MTHLSRGGWWTGSALLMMLVVACPRDQAPGGGSADTATAVAEARPSSAPTTRPGAAASDATLDPAAMHQRSLVFDSHIDISYLLSKHKIDIGARRDKGHFDLIRAREGGLDAAFWVAFVASDYNRPGTSPDAKGGAFAEAQRQIGALKQAVTAHPDKVELANDPDQLQKIVASGKHAAVIALENGSPIEGKLENLRALQQQGVRYITPVHSKDNHLCDSSFDERHSHKGLTAFGREVVKEMNRLGIIIDVSHVSDQAFEQILELSQTPVVATHSGLRTFRKMERNISDEMLSALAKRGGLLQLVFGSWFLDETAAKTLEAIRDELKAMEKRGASEAERDRREQELWQAFAAKNVTLEQFVDQIDHAVKIAGVDHIGLGSDFEGVYGTPEGLTDVSAYPRLTAALLKPGYTPEQIDKINGGNLLRVWRQVLAAAVDTP